MPLEDTSQGGSRRPLSTASPVTPAASTPSLKDQNESSATRQQLNTKRSLRKLTRHSYVPSSQTAGSPAFSAMSSPSPPPSVQPRKSSTSLFSLFSKPKVEKARGYGGEGPVPATAPSVTAQQLKPALKPTPPVLPSSPPQQRQSSQSIPTRPPSTIREAPRTQSAFGNRSIRDDDLQRLREQRTALWSPPPLFQAFARSVKNGLAEVSTGAVIEKPPFVRPKTSHKQEQERPSLESENSSSRTRMTVKAPSSHIADAQKIVVLLDDGHILQYPHHGPTNRLPERALGLCQDSAAMTCDVTASDKHAVRIVQSVAQKSFSFSNTLSRLTRRSANAKREAASFVLIFAEQQEAEDWLRAVRIKIAELCHPESIMLNRDTPISSKVDSVIGDSKRLSSASLTMPPAPPEKEVTPSPITVLPTVPERRTSLILSSPPPDQTNFDLDSDSDRKGSLEMLEEEAEKLVSSQIPASLEPSPKKRTSDVPSYTSSHNTSMGEQSSNALRNSARMSYLSNGTALTSRTSSLTSEPSPLKSSPESSFESKNPYRNLSSYQSSKRRSLLTSTSQPTIDFSSPTVSLLGQVASVTEQSAPIVKEPAPVLAPIHAVQMLTALPEVRQTEHKATTPPILEEDERPESIIADLPPPSTWSSKISPKSRHSMLGQPMTDRQLHRISSAPSLQTTATPQQSRRASQAFRMPLKVNTDSSANRPLGRTRSDRKSFSPDAAAGGQPKVFTLEAKVDPRHQRLSMISGYASGDMRTRSAQRLSLFPSPLLPQDAFPEDRRASLLNNGQPGRDNVPPRRASLQRPTSLQVRTDHAPFLSSRRTSGLSTSPPNAENALTSPSSTTVPLPIRTLKPSRSSSAPSAPRGGDLPRSQSPTDPFLSSSNIADNALHVSRRQSYVSKRSPSPASAPPLAPLPRMPAVPMGNSFAQQRMSQRHSYMPRHSMMAATVQVSSLGPPAPPPSAPLPAPPGGAPPGIIARGNVPILPGPAGSRRASAASIMLHAQSGTHGSGLGIQVGS